MVPRAAPEGYSVRLWAGWSPREVHQVHEMSLAESVWGIVAEASAADGCERVSTVVLELGELAAVEEEALLFCLEMVLRGGVAEGAEIVVERLAGVGWCPVCESRVALHQRHDPCLMCGGYGVRAIAGTELRVKALEVR